MATVRIEGHRADALWTLRQDEFMAPSLRDLYLAALELATAEALAASDSLGLPSACEGWTIADVVLHLVAVQQRSVIDALERGTDPAATGPDRAELPRVRAISAWERTARAAARVATECDDSRLDLLTLPTADLAIHSWDIRWGIARVGLAERLELPEPLLAFLEGMPSRVDDASMRARGVLAGQLPSPVGASRTELVMAWTGRRV